MKAYVIVFNSVAGPRDRIKQWADKSPLVHTWRGDLPMALYVLSESSASELAKDLESKLGKTGRYLILEIGENRQGRLPQESWYLFRHKQHKPK